MSEIVAGFLWRNLLRRARRTRKTRKERTNSVGVKMYIFCEKSDGYKFFTDLYFLKRLNIAYKENFVYKKMRRTKIEDLPDELLCHIFTFLEVKDLLTVNMISHRWSALATVNSLWQKLYEQEDWNVTTPHNLPWKQIYIHNALLERNLDNVFIQGKFNVHYLLGHLGAVLCLHWMKNDDLLVTSGCDKTLRLWSMKENKYLYSLEQVHNRAVCSVALTHQTSFGKKDKILLSGDGDGKIVIWPNIWLLDDLLAPISLVPNGHKNALGMAITLHAHDGFVSNIQVTEDNRHFVSCGADSLIKYWDICQLSDPISSFSNPKQCPILCSKYQDNLMATGNDRGSIHISDIRIGKSVSTLTGHKAEVSAIDFDPSRFLLASGDWDNIVNLWDLRVPAIEKKYISGKSRPSRTMALQFDTKRIIIGNDSAELRVFHINDGQHVCTINKQTGPIRALKFDEKRLVAASYDHSVVVYSYPFATNNSNGTGECTIS